MTLGASEITLVELNLLYGGILNGEQHIVEAPWKTCGIHRIVDDSGKIIYELTPKKVESVDPIVGHQVANILYNVVQNGTGRRAKGKIQINGQDVPALGKTGTTNDYKRAVFSGIIPKEYAGKWSVKDGIVLSAYVGYDKEKTNEKKKRSLHRWLQGGLPIWLEAAKAIADAGLVGELNQPLNGDLLTGLSHKQTHSMRQKPAIGTTLKTIHFLPKDCTEFMRQLASQESCSASTAKRRN